MSKLEDEIDVLARTMDKLRQEVLKFPETLQVAVHEERRRCAAVVALYREQIEGDLKEHDDLGRSGVEVVVELLREIERHVGARADS